MGNSEPSARQPADDAVIRPMIADDYEAITAIWRASPGIVLTSADSVTGLTAFLERNPNLSQVALRDNEIIGGVLCGHDGRRGFIHHLAVHPSARRAGLGRMLTAACLDGLRRAGIEKCHLFIQGDNLEGQAFWRQIGWIRRDELVMMSKTLDKPN